MMTAEQLKNSILQIAMQGKLVEQRPEEGTGKDVYKRLKQEQKAMIACGRIKQKHLLGTINVEETDFEIPDSWEWARIEECGYFISGYTPKNNQLSHEGTIPYFKVSDMNTIGNEKFLKITESYLSTEIKEPRCYEEGTIVYPKNGGAVFTNKKRILAQKSVVDLNTGGYKPFSPIDFDYIYLLYTSIDFKQCYKGTALPTIDMDKLRQRVFPIPPLAEQKRIVAKIEELMPFVEQYAVTSTKLNTLNATFPEMMKKSILQEAVQGKLVPQDPNDEPASELLKKIAEEKKRLIKEGKIKKQKPLPEITEDEIPFDIPENWEWVRLGAIITDTEAGKSPQCKNRPATEKEWGVIKTTAIQDGYFLKEENKVLPEDFEIKESQVIHVDDLLITRAGPQNRTGITCIVEAEPQNLILSDKTVRLAYMKEFINNKYLMYAKSVPPALLVVCHSPSGANCDSA